MEQKKKVIGTTTYQVTQMDAVSALKVQTKLIKILGAGALSLLDSKGNAKEKIKTIIPIIMENFDDEVVVELVLSLFEKGVMTELPGGGSKGVDFSTHFAGKAMEMWKVVGFILEANFMTGEQLESGSPTTPKASLTQES